MILPQNRLYHLTRMLFDLNFSHEDIKRVCSNAEVPGRHEFAFDEPPLAIWRKIISKVSDNQAKAISLLQAVAKELMRSGKSGEIVDEYSTEINISKTLRQENIKKALLEKRCVVFLGPEVLKVSIDNDRRISFNQFVASHLKETMDDNLIYFNHALETNLSYLAQCYTNDQRCDASDIGELASTLYEQAIDEHSLDTNFYGELARLPLGIIINASPDDQLYRVLESQGGRMVEQAFYDLSNVSGKSVLPNTQAKEPVSNEQQSPAITETEDSVLIYNIFGSFNNVDSILFTESQFLNFIDSVIQNNPGLDSRAMKRLNDCDTYLFLGFDFEQWYFKVLFRLFQLKKQEYASISCGKDYNTAPGLQQNREFFEQEFKIFFVNDQIPGFINQILNPPIS